MCWDRVIDAERPAVAQQQPQPARTTPPSFALRASERRPLRSLGEAGPPAAQTSITPEPLPTLEPVAVPA